MTLGAGRYRIERLLGRGSSKDVYLAHDAQMGRSVAIGVFSGGPAAGHRERVLREVRTLAGLSHPTIATVYNLEEEDGMDFLVSEYLPGGSVAERLTQLGEPLPVAEALRNRP